MSYPTPKDPDLEAKEPPQPQQSDYDQSGSQNSKPEDEVIFTDWAAF